MLLWILRKFCSRTKNKDGNYTILLNKSAVGTLMEELIKGLIKESIDAKKGVLDNLVPEIMRASQILINTLNSGNKIFICGNGGSAADSQHFSTELVAQFEKKRKALPVLELTTNTSTLTAISNDDG